MKKRFFLQSFICLLAVSCSIQEFDTKDTPVLEDDVFYASLESNSAPDTKVYVDENIKILWDADDRISIFNNTTLNEEYRFDGQTGANAGFFKRVKDVFGTGNETDFICAVYPFLESTKISNSDVLTLTLPEKQVYKKDSFGPGANTMVSVTEDNLLKFKNLGGYLVLKFYGEGVTVSSIRLEGRNGEKISGEATVKPVVGVIPEISMASTAGTSITLTCDNPVELGATKEDATVFWMVVPPTEFTQGFRLMLTDPDGNVFIKDTDVDLPIARNGVVRIAPISVALNSNVLNGLSIDGVSSVDKNYKTEFDGNSTFTVTMPTVTDFSKLKFGFEFSGESLIADGKDIVPGETPIDASHDVTLTVRSGNQGKNYTLKARNTGLPVVRITTEGFGLAQIEGDPTHQTVWRPTDLEDPSTGTATIRIELPDGTIDCETTMQIKGRGNATWGYPKKPYALKFPKKKEVLGMPEHKRWILLANWKDRTLLRNDAAFWLSRQVSDVIKSKSFPYTVRGQFVELEFNGEHRGNYYLCEQIKINKKRVNITEMDSQETDPLKITGGYLMEIDNNWDDDNSFYSGDYPNSQSNNGFKFKYQFKEPDEEDRSDAAFAYMTKHIADVESLIKRIPKTNNYTLEERQEYRKYIDVESAIWFMIINELTSNGDFYNENYSDTYKGPHSTYMYKDRDKLNDDGTTTISKIHMGPVWDFDYLTFMPSRANKWAGADQKNYYYNYFYADSDFHSEMTQLWNTYKGYFSGLPSYIDQMAEKIRLSEEFDGEMWWNTSTHGHKDQDQNGELDMSFDEAVANIKSGFTGKWSFINNNISNLSYQKPGSSWGW